MTVPDKRGSKARDATATDLCMKTERAEGREVSGCECGWPRGECALEPAQPEAHPCHRSGCPGTCRYVEDEYDSLANGGSYEKWQCDHCGKVTWISLPD